MMDAPLNDPPSTVDEEEVTAPSASGISALIGDLRQLAADARNLAEAELAYQTSRAKLAGEAARNIAIFGVAACLLAFFALGALTVGLLLALTPLVTAWGATAIVVGALLIGALICLNAVNSRLKRLRRAWASDPETGK